MKTAWLAAVGAVLLTSSCRLNANEVDESVKRAVGKLGGEVAYDYIFTSFDGEDHPYSYQSRLNQDELKELKRYYWLWVEHGEGGLAGVPDPLLEVRVSLFASGAAEADLDKLAPIRDEVAVLDLTYTKVTDAGLGRLKTLSNLRKLYLTSTPVKGETLGELSGLGHLEELRLDYSLMTDKGLAALTHLTHLQTLDLSGMRVKTQEDAATYGGVTAAGLASLNDIPTLRVLALADVKQVQPTGTIVGEAVALPNLARLRRLRRLNLSGTKLEAAGLSGLSTLSRLKELDLSRTGVAKGQLQGLTNRCLRQIATFVIELKTPAWLLGLTSEQLRQLGSGPLSSLTFLDLSEADIDDRDVDWLADHGMTNLKTISLSRTSVTVNGVRTLLQKVKPLDELDLSYTRVTDQGIGDLKKSGCLCRLAVLDLSATAVTDKGVELLGNLPALKELYLSDTRVGDKGLMSLAALQPKLEGLSLSRTGVTYMGLGEVRNFTTLKQLYLEDLPAVTDALAYLIIRDMTNLGGLYIKGTKVSDDGVLQLRKVRPNCLISRSPD